MQRNNSCLLPLVWYNANGSKTRVDERSVLITLPPHFKVIRQLHFSRMNLLPPEKKNLKMISCTYSLPLHEELKFSRPLGILKSEKKMMIGHKTLLNSMRASSPWDAGLGEMLRGCLFIFGVVFLVRSD